MTLKQALKEFRASDDYKNQSDIHWFVWLLENPNSPLSLTGAVDLYNHDIIHILLNRKMESRDEAFVIGFTMGNSTGTNRYIKWLFGVIAKYLYPEGYKFTEEERYIFYSGVMAGSKCSSDLSKVNFEELVNYKVDHVRELLGVDKELLKCYYCTEKKLFASSRESQRL